MIKDCSLVVFANIAGGGMAEPGMSGGDRIAIEFLKRWTHAFRPIIILTTLAGRAMYVRNSVQSEYMISSRTIFPKHSLLNNVALQFVTTVRSVLRIPTLLKRRTGVSPVLFSTSDFPGDSLPALVMKVLRPECVWISTFYLFAPTPLSSENPYHGGRMLRSALWSIAQWMILMMIRRFADMVFVTNELDRWKVADAKRLTVNRVIAVRGGVDLKMSEKIPDTSVKNYEAVFIGRLHPQKGVLELIEIWKLVCTKFPEARLAIIGNGELEGEVRALINRNGLSRNITMLGFVDGYEKIRVFKKSKIVLHPATYDSGGMASAEAMACGLPGICFDLPALRTYYARGMIKIPRNDLQRFAEEITLLLKDSKRYAMLSEEAVEQSKSWDWDLNASKVLEEIRHNPWPNAR